MTEFLANTKETMSSMDIAELTGKRHSYVLRDIRLLLEQGIQESVFSATKYIRSLPNGGSKSQSYYLVNKDGIGILAHRYGSKPLAELSGNIVLVADRFEDSFMSKLTEVLKELSIPIYTQYAVGKYRLDAYIPSYTLAIEYDESQHDYMIEPDSVREVSIKASIGCSFIRLSYKDSDATNIGKVLNRLFA